MTQMGHLSGSAAEAERLLSVQLRDPRQVARQRARGDGGREPGYLVPRQTGRAAFPHPAPTSDSDGKTLRPSVRAPASVTRFPALCRRVRSWLAFSSAPPFAPRLRCGVPGFGSATLIATMTESDFSRRASSASAPRLPDADHRGLAALVNHETSPVPVQRVSAQGLRPCGPRELRYFVCAYRTRRHPEASSRFSQLESSWPVQTLFYGNREVSLLTKAAGRDGPHREGEEPKPMMHGREKSDSVIVSDEVAEQNREPAAEAMGAKGGGRGEREPATHAPDTEAGKGVHRRGARTDGRKGFAVTIRGGSGMRKPHVRFWAGTRYPVPYRHRLSPVRALAEGPLTEPTNSRSPSAAGTAQVAPFASFADAARRFLIKSTFRMSRSAAAWKPRRR